MADNKKSKATVVLTTEQKMKALFAKAVTVEDMYDMELLENIAIRAREICSETGMGVRFSLESFLTAIYGEDAQEHKSLPVELKTIFDKKFNMSLVKTKGLPQVELDVYEEADEPVVVEEEEPTAEETEIVDKIEEIEATQSKADAAKAKAKKNKSRKGN